MKMVKSLLLGSAAGLVAVAGAQAADLPVKAKPVLYVKICDLYGAGFYYIPGTDICVKFGGYIRHQHYYKQGAAPTLGPYANASGRFTRLDGSFGNDYVMRTRAVLTWDTRQSTSYGTLRTYWLLGFSQDSPGAAGLYATRAFIQFAGFTFGKATSFFELHNGAAYSYMAPRFDPTTGDSGWQVAGYTAQFGNGVSATFALEEPRRSLVVRSDRITPLAAVGSTSATLVTGIPGVPWVTDQKGSGVPDFVANWRVSQTWGTAQFALAAHEVAGSYYGTLEGTGHPKDKWGWAALAAVVLTNAGCPGCILSLQGVYTEGAARYAASLGHNVQFNKYGAGAKLGLGWIAEGIYGNVLGAPVELTKILAFQGAYEYVWNPNWKSSIYGGYATIDYNANATAIICGPVAGVSTAAAQSSYGFSNCNPDFKFWSLGHRTQWTPVPGLYMGVDILYEKLLTSNKGTASNVPQSAPRPAGPYSISDMDNLSLTWRIHRDVVP